jgi:hypothetical protein
MKNKFDFTDGEWRVENPTSKKGFTVWCNIDKTGSMQIAETGYAMTFDKANARLISKAPKMLKMLIELTKSLEEVDGNFKNNIGGQKSVKLIESATGMKWEDIK